MARKSSLGKGFGSLLPDDFDKSMLLDKQDRIQKINISEIQANPNQPRQDFAESGIIELSESIKNYGILQPLIVTSASGGKYEIVAGERRFRAAKKAGMKQVPALVRSHQELEKLEIGLVENVQRVDLSPLEQAISIARLNEEFNIDLKDIAKRLGKAHTTVINSVRLLQLPEKARKALEQGRISEGHARAVLALREHPDLQSDLVDHVVRLGWSVRKAEDFVSGHRQQAVSKKPALRKPLETKRSKLLAEKLGTRVIIKPSAKGGKIEINYKSKEELSRILKDLSS